MYVDTGLRAVGGGVKVELWSSGLVSGVKMRLGGGGTSCSGVVGRRGGTCGIFGYSFTAVIYRLALHMDGCILQKASVIISLLYSVFRN